MPPYNTICNEIDDNDDDSDDDLADEMKLRMERDGQRVTLRLKKNDNVRDDIPVFTAKDNVIRKMDRRELPVSIYCCIVLGIGYLDTTMEYIRQIRMGILQRMPIH